MPLHHRHLHHQHHEHDCPSCSHHPHPHAHVSIDHVKDLDVLLGESLWRFHVTKEHAHLQHLHAAYLKRFLHVVLGACIQQRSFCGQCVVVHGQFEGQFEVNLRSIGSQFEDMLDLVILTS